MKDLMTPRYIVIADYPNSEFKLNDIIEIDREVAGTYRNGIMINMTSSYLIFESLNIDKYPHIFSKVSWWEFRTAEEMKQVEYVSTSEGVQKVEGFSNEVFKIEGERYVSGLGCQPATLSDYTNYLTNKNK